MFMADTQVCLLHWRAGCAAKRIREASVDKQLRLIVLIMAQAFRIIFTGLYYYVHLAQCYSEPLLSNGTRRPIG